MYIKGFSLIRFGPRRSSKVVSFLSLSSLGWVEGGEVGVGVGGLLGYLLGWAGLKVLLTLYLRY